MLKNIGKLSIIVALLPCLTTCCIDSWKKNIEDFKAWPFINSSLTNLSSKLFTSSDNRYVFSLCNDVNGETRSRNKGGVWDTVDKAWIGSSESAILEYKTGNSWLAYRAAKADPCIVKLNGVNVSSSHASTVLFTCDPNTAEPKFAALANVDDDSKCIHVFVLGAKQFCTLTSINSTSKSIDGPSVISTIKPLGSTVETGVKSVSAVTSVTASNTSHEEHGRNVAAFFLILFMLIAAYFALGFVYKRYVEGARGVDQIPNHLLWIRLVRALQMPFIMTSSSETGRRGAGWRRPPDHFRYDQPPLLGDDGDVEQNAASERPIRRQASAAAAQNSAESPDSDVRLLIV